MTTTYGLRFAMVTTFYPPYHFGGEAIFVGRLAHALAHHGHRVDAIHDADAYDVLGTGIEPRLDLSSTLICRTPYPLVFKDFDFWQDHRVLEMTVDS